MSGSIQIPQAFGQHNFNPFCAHVNADAKLRGERHKDFAFDGVLRMSHECDSLTGRVPRFGGRFKGRSSGCTAGQNQRETNYFAGGAGFFINKGFTYPAGNFLSGSGRTLR